MLKRRFISLENISCSYFTMAIYYGFSERYCQTNSCVLLDFWLVLSLSILAGIFVCAVAVRSILKFITARRIKKSLSFNDKSKRSFRSPLKRAMSKSELAFKKDATLADIHSRKTKHKDGKNFLQKKDHIFENKIVPIQLNAGTPSNTKSFLKRSKSTRERMAFGLNRNSPNRDELKFDEPNHLNKDGLLSKSTELRERCDKEIQDELSRRRRVSVQAQVTFKVGTHVASVYEIKLPEIHLAKRLAVGPLSEVYGGIWRGTKVAIKLLMTRDGNDQNLDEAILNFRREIWVMSSLKHPNVLQLIGASLSLSCYVLVCEYMTNGSLYEYIRDETAIIPFKMVVDFATHIASGMGYLHEQNILQRDLKSKNLLLSDHLVVKVSDFGLSRYKDKKNYGDYTYVGTPFWAAPEVIRRDEYSEKADVYSFGIVLWELIERKDPYIGYNPLQVPLLVVNEGLRPSSLSNDVPDCYSELVHRCWDTNPNNRPNFDEILELIHEQLLVMPPEKKDVLSYVISKQKNTSSSVGLSNFKHVHEKIAGEYPKGLPTQDEHISY